MVYPNQFYQQPNVYQTPQYQNFQAQQRQEQLNQVFANSYNYNFTRDRYEAENWQIAPGNNLVFRDQNGLFFYTKTLGFGPNEKPVFSVYKREDYVEQPQQIQQQAEVIEQNPLKEEFEKYQNSTKLELDNLKKTIEELKELISQSNKPPHFNKKGGNNR